MRPRRSRRGSRSNRGVESSRFRVQSITCAATIRITVRSSWLVTASTAAATSRLGTSPARARFSRSRSSGRVAANCANASGSGRRPSSSSRANCSRRAGSIAGTVPPSRTPTRSRYARSLRKSRRARQLSIAAASTSAGMSLISPARAAHASASLRRVRACFRGANWTRYKG